MPSSTQLRYAAAYFLITIAVLLFLNIYAPMTIRNLVFRAQKTAMEDKAQLFVSSLSALTAMDSQTVHDAVESVDDLHTNRVIVTDPQGLALYDSLERDNAEGKLALLPQIVEALSGNDVFYITYRDGALESQAAMPIMAYNKLVGAVYLMEYDTDQGALIAALQTNILRISAVLAGAVALFSVFFSVAFSRRVQRLLESMRQMRDGNYQTKLHVRGHDEMERLGRAFNELSDRLNQSEQVRKEFVSNASHELKTPLASIKLLSDSILQNDMDAATMREFVADIGSEADRLTRLSEKLLELTKLDSTPAQEHELVDAGAVVRRVMRMLTPLAGQQHIALDCQCQPGCTVLSVEDDLYQIVFNLAENAIKYNRPEGSVSITVRHDGENVTLQVDDTGVGIPEQAREHIFERFYRVDKARSRKAGGAGLGLSIVHDMVQRNDGVITVSQREGGGSRFSVVFPYFDMQEDRP